MGDTDSFGSIKGVVETVEVELEQSFTPTESEKQISVATGFVTLYNNSGSAQPLIATTRLLTADGVLFRLKDKVVAPANGTVEAEVYADVEGESGNIGPSEFTIPGLNEAKQKEIYATSVKKMEGGIRNVGILGKSDMKKAQEAVLLVLEQEGTKQLQAKNSSLRGVFKLIDSEVNSNAEVGDEVSEFILTGKAKVLGVFYKAEDLQSLAEKSLARKAIDDAETVQLSNEEITVMVEDYNLTKDQILTAVNYA